MILSAKAQQIVEKLADYEPTEDGQLNRKRLLGQLQAVTPGLAKRELLQQTTHFVFQHGLVHTFNDETACTGPCDLQTEGAVRATPLLAILRQFEHNHIRVEESVGELIITEQHRRAGIRLEKKIALPL